MTTIKFMAKFHAIGSALLITKGKLINLRYPFLSSNVYSSPQMAEGAKGLFHIYTEFLKSVSEAEDLHVKFTKYCNEDGAAREMFSCLRRQVDNPFNTIIHGEMWEKNLLFASHKIDKLDNEVDAAANDIEESDDLMVLDWKNAKIASATKDLAFFLLSSTSNSLREDCLEDILETYYSIFCNSLKILGVNTDDCQGLSFQEFRTDYAVSTKGAFLQSVCVLVQELTFMEHKLFVTESPHQTAIHIQNLGLYERRALELMYDRVLNETHFDAKSTNIQENEDFENSAI
jgi:thiamine kinase-like enzyme